MRITEENFIYHLRKKNEQALEYVIDNYGGIVRSVIKRHLYNLPDYYDGSWVTIMLINNI